MTTFVRNTFWGTKNGERGAKKENQEGRKESDCDTLSLSSLSLPPSPPFLLLMDHKPLFANALTAGPNVASMAPFQVAMASEASVGGRRGSSSCWSIFFSRRKKEVKGQGRFFFFRFFLFKEKKERWKLSLSSLSLTFFFGAFGADDDESIIRATDR